MIVKRGMYRNRRQRMTKFTWALREQSSATLDGSGNASFSIIPGGAREKWVVTLISTSCTLTDVNNPTLTVYRGCVLPSNQISGTYTGSLDTNSTDRFELAMNEGLWFVYTNGDPGSIATARIEGIRYVWDYV